MGRTSNKKTTKKTLVDICILTAGRFDMLKKCLESIEAQTFTDYEIHIFDNGSNVEEKTANLSLFQKYDAKRSEQNTGFPHGANECIRMGKAPLVLFMNDDIVLKPNTLDVLVNRMDDEKIGMCGAKTLFPENSVSPNKPAGKVQHIGHAFDIKGNIIHPLVGWDADNPKCCISRDVQSVTGAIFIIRRSIFNKIGGFFEGYGLGTWEDVELSCAVRYFGHRVFIDTDAVAYHYVGASAEKLQVAYPLNMNSMMFKSRWSNVLLPDGHKAMEWDEDIYW